MAKTHPKFKSILPEIESAEDIYNAIGLIFLYQNKFQKRYPPSETNHWQDLGEENQFQRLDDFVIDLETIDRVYHIKWMKRDDGSGVDHELVARMEYECRSLYLHVKVFTEHVWDGIVGDGEIYLTFNPQLFLKSTVNSECHPKRIWRSMLDDGISVDEPSEFDLKQTGSWRNVPPLTFLSHMTVYQKQEQLRDYFNLLPKGLFRDIEDFLTLRKARDHREEVFPTYPDYFGVYLTSSMEAQ